MEEDLKKDVVRLLKFFYEEDCTDTELSDEELKALSKKYPNGIEKITFDTRMVLRKLGEKV